MPQRYWSRYIDAKGAWLIDKKNGQVLRPPGEDLSALRSGLGREALTVPKMWPYYTSLVDDDLARRGAASPAQEAEHAALALYGLHQQSQDTPMHRPGVGLGTALLALRRHPKYSPEAVDTRVAAVATTTSVPALLGRLRGLITQLRTISQPLDYDRLMKDIDAWAWSDGRQRVRRAWAQGYQQWAQQPTVPAETHAP